MANVTRCDGCGYEERNLTGSWWTIALTEGSRNWEHRLQIRSADRWVDNCSPPYHFCSLTCIRLFIEGQSPESTKPREQRPTAQSSGHQGAPLGGGGLLSTLAPRK